MCELNPGRRCDIIFPSAAWPPKTVTGGPYEYLLEAGFLFYIGSSLGWVLELFFRRFISGNNPERKWINPGFMVGPYVPLYGTGLCILYLVSRLSESRQIANPVWNHIAMLVLMAAAMTAIEYIAGILLLKVMNARLWDYSRRWGNVNGLICPLFPPFGQ